MDYSKLKVPELRKLLSDINLSTKGIRAVLIKRLKEHEIAEESVEKIEKPVETYTEVDPKFYTNMTNIKLKQILKQFKLSIPGKRDDLIDRIITYKKEISIKEPVTTPKKEEDDIFKKLNLPALYDEKNRMTIPIINRFEKAKLVAARAEQLSKGAIPLVEVPDNTIDLLKIAVLEMKQKKEEFPIKLVRPIPGKSDPEIWEYHELYDPFL